MMSGCKARWTVGFAIVLLVQPIVQATFLPVEIRETNRHGWSSAFRLDKTAKSASTPGGDHRHADNDAPATSPITPFETFDTVQSKPTISRSSFLAGMLLAAPTAAMAMSSKENRDELTPSTRPGSSVDHMIDQNAIKSQRSISLILSEQIKNDQRLSESLSGFVAGATLTVTKTLVKFPLDTATVRLQMPSKEYSIIRLAQLFEDCYRGVWTPLLANIPAGAVFFAVKDAVKESFKEADTTSELAPWLTTCAAVAVAQIPYWIVRNPSEVVKTRQQAGLPGYSEGVSSLLAYEKVWQDAVDGLEQQPDAFSKERAAANNNTMPSQQQNIPSASTSLSSTTAKASRIAEAYYLGYAENIIYAYPADVIKFLIYDGIKRGKERKLTPVEGAVAGAAATGIAQLVTTPLDVIRNRIMTRQQQQPQEQENESENDDQQPSYIHALIQLGREEGLLGLFAGAAPRVGKAILSGAIQFATYEETKQMMADLFAPPPPPAR